MNATLLNLPTETPETEVCCENCPAAERLERALEELRVDFRREVGYWKSRHADAVKRIEQLKEELHQSQGQVRALKDKLFGRKSEKSGSSDRSNELFDPEEAAVAGNKRGARPGHVGHRRRDYSHLVDDSRIPLDNNASERAVAARPRRGRTSTARVPRGVAGRLRRCFRCWRRWPSAK
jgi:hypothetical protein